MGCWAVGSEQEGGRKLKHHRGGRTIGSVPWRLGLFMAWLVMAAQFPPAHAETQTVEFFPTADTYIKRGNPNRNHGTEAVLQVGSAGNRRTLIRFDEDDIRSTLEEGIVESARLRLYIADSRGGPGVALKTVDVYRLTSAWTEKGATWSCPDDPNGNPRADCADPWNGGLFETALLASVTHPGRRTGWISFDVTSELERILTGGSHEGWILRNGRGPAGLIEYTAREGNPEFVPRLEVVFQEADPGPPDEVSPTVVLHEPFFEILYLPSTRIVVEYFDRETGIDRESVRLFLDGDDLTADCSVGFVVAICEDVPLAPGFHTLRVEVRDSAGNLQLFTHDLQRTEDAVAPTVVIDPGFGPLYVNNPPRYIQYNFVDGESGIDRDSSRFWLDQTDVTSQCSMDRAGFGGCTFETFPDGDHTLRVEILDFAGNVGIDSINLQVVTNQQAPIVTFTSPVAGELVTTSPALVQGTVEDDNGIAELTINRVPATVVGNTFSVTVPLEDGKPQLIARADDGFFKTSSLEIRVNVDTQPPELGILRPQPGELVNAASILLRGKVYDRNGLQRLEVNGQLVVAEFERFQAEVSLELGSNTIEVIAVDGAGHESTATVEVIRVDAPRISIDTPESGAFVSTSTVSVFGEVSVLGAVVAVNGVPASVSGTRFSALGIPVAAGRNVLTATVTSPTGRVSAASVVVLRDLIAPRVHIDLPRDGALIETPLTDVAGTVSEGNVTVSVNGVVAEVRNRTFLARGVPLASGENLLVAEGVDTASNQSQSSRRVTREIPTAPRMRLVGGGGQSGLIATELPNPLAVQLLDAAGDPVAGEPVLFEVLDNNGHLEGEGRRISRVTDGGGQAEARFTLGTRAGLGNQRVRATAPGFGEQIFLASAEPGPPAQIFVESGDQQRDVAGQRLANPLVVSVTDSAFNRLNAVEVVFTAVEGGGRFANGLMEQTLVTGADGKATAQLTLGPEPGIANNIAEAVLSGLEESPFAAFVASGLAVGDPSETTVHGVVLDNSEAPVPGVTVRIAESGQTTRTNGQGIFRIADAPVGLLDLIVDGSTTDRAGTWPTLEFPLVSVAGRENQLGRPIFLLPLDTERGRFVNDAVGVILKLPEVPGFALEIEPGAVTFPDGGRSGVVSVTSVHSDKIPMTPGFGQQPRFVITIQPSNALFDPPARLSLPNVDGLAPGVVTEMYSFDHDQGAFVSIGPGTVSEDGTVIQSNPGSGVVKAGWHCGGNPTPSGSPHNCPQCKVCDGSRCVPGCPIQLPTPTGLTAALTTCACDDGDVCTDGNCETGDCRVAGRREIKSVVGKVEEQEDYEGIFQRNKEYQFTAEVDAVGCEPEVRFSFGNGISKRGQPCGPKMYCSSSLYLREGLYGAKVEAVCDRCNTARGSDEMKVDLFKVEIRLSQVGNTVISTDGKYTEDTTVKVEAVRARDGSVIDSFGGVVFIEDESMVYDQNTTLGADLPREVNLSSGVGFITAKSLSEAENEQVPKSAILASTNLPLFQDEKLEIPQWVDVMNIDPGRSAGGSLGYDWFEARMRDLFDQAEGDLATIISTNEGYIGTTTLTNPDAIGETNLLTGGNSHTSINPRKDGLRTNIVTQAHCGIPSLKHFDGVAYHEVRHGYQWALVHRDDLGTDDGPGFNNSDDGDILVDEIPISPSDIFLDTADKREVCNIDTSVREDGMYRGDSVKDSYAEKDWASRAWEMDAEVYASQNASP
jgi:hypothetical protein